MSVWPLLLFNEFGLKETDVLQLILKGTSLEEHSLIYIIFNSNNITVNCVDGVFNSLKFAKK